LKEKNYTNKLTDIEEFLDEGKYETAMKESASLLEIAMREIFRKAMATLNLMERKELMEAEIIIGKGTKSVDDFTFGELVGLYRESKLFKKWEKSSKIDLGLLMSIDLSPIVKKRNTVQHKGSSCTQHEAEFVFNYLKNFFASLGLAKIEDNIQKVFQPEESTSPSNILDTTVEIKRYKNTYDVTQKKEKRRIKMQRNLTLEEDITVIRKLLKKDSNVRVLDIGCNTGEYLTSRFEALECLDKVQVLLGIDVNENIIKDARSKAKKESFHYIQLDVESSDFLDNLRDIMEEKSINKFDFVAVPMVLMHLKKPYKLLKVIRKILSSDGKIFIRDMDDTLSMAYPDEDNLLGKMLDISSKLPTTGYRENGRQIYSFLKKSGYSNIQMHPESINTIGRSHDDRETLFNINFGFVQGDLELAKETYVKEYKWMEEAFDELEELFQSTDFFYQMGTVVYTASK